MIYRSGFSPEDDSLSVPDGLVVSALGVVDFGGAVVPGEV
ncbi:hypothetical protein LEP1GSC178_3741 [Leptospira licerasiae str. MMD4847]|uniref:Uncharacterized protein n=1 Tax=Leptospira licerasiae str. MMD4847 TaxID=1049971 RepID=A0ABN0HCW2_9LEPT|nr:hypothetical protein LEP1GSC178_3741 [Leptospira licerasiae str. MMD4847]